MSTEYYDYNLEEVGLAAKGGSATTRKRWSPNQEQFLAQTAHMMDGGGGDIGVQLRRGRARTSNNAQGSVADAEFGRE